jgi:drug/metabolite transporter (DMT)-like permease
MILVKHLVLNGFFLIIELIFIKSTFAVLSSIPICAKNIKTDFKKLLTSKSNIIFIILLGLFSFADAFCWNSGIVTVPINNAAIIAFASPIITSIFSYFFLKEKIASHLKYSLAINFFIVLFIYLGDSKIGFNAGYFFLLTSIVAYAFSAILIKKLNTISAGFILMFRSTSIALIAGFMLNKVPEIKSPQHLLFVLILSIGYLVERYCITKVYTMTDISKIQPWRYFNQIFSAISAYLILCETITFNQGLACLVIICTNFITYFLTIRKRKRNY